MTKNPFRYSKTSPEIIQLAVMMYLPRTVITNRLRSSGAAMNNIENRDRQEVGRLLNNRAENGHLPFRRREQAMSRFRRMSNLQKFSSTHASFQNQFNLDCQIDHRSTFKSMRNAALSEWRQLLAGYVPLFRTMLETGSH